MLLASTTLLRQPRGWSELQCGMAQCQLQMHWLPLLPPCVLLLRQSLQSWTSSSQLISKRTLPAKRSEERV